MATLNTTESGTIDLGTIQTESSTKDSNLFVQPLPYSDSSESILMDIMGTSRTITISGKKVSTTKSDLTTFVSSLESIQNGQQSGASYVGDFVSTSKTVLIQTFTWTWNEADPQRISYDLTLMEGSAI